MLKESLEGGSGTSPTTPEERRRNYEQDLKLLTKNDNSVTWYKKSQDVATPQEVEANQIVISIREDERDRLFGNLASEAIPGDETRDMGGQFLTNKERIQQSIVYKIACKMPKGAHLHLHFNAELPPDQLIQKAKERPYNMFVRSTMPLVDANSFRETEMVFSVLEAGTQVYDIFSPDYIPRWNKNMHPQDVKCWMLWKDFSDRFPSEVRRLNPQVQWSDPATDKSLEDPDKWIKQKMILSEDEVYGLNQTTNGVWARFNQATRCFKGLMNYESVYRWYIGQAIDNMIDDGVMYAELRPMLLDKYIPSDDGSTQLNHDRQMEIIQEEVAKKQAELKAQGKGDKFPFGLKIIYCAPRSIPLSMMRTEIADCIKLKKKFGDLICGFDLVGAEDRPNHIGFYRDLLLEMQDECRDDPIPYMFHAGETLLDMGGSKNPNNSNLYDAVLLNAKRIGHGFSLLKHPKLVDEFKKRNICIELCPTSNELLHLCRNIKEHPYPEILAAGIPCTVNSDNPSLFSNSVSFEFYQILVGSPTMNLHGWRQLAEWSIEYSCLSKDEQKRAMEIFHREWAKFCDWIIEEFGSHAKSLGPLPL
ncbi:Metallo-dependent hydrolase [Microthyrium microscopicum]|uniref:Metallo-dependent hydrolase n=1 Tax=Microthyrium microscopicum TaxID=703497 RepID=A0A6A6U3Q6_9PEZI|nr:Metallo-dependent hydrolase [Microthyrium microscopicum]